MINKLEKKILAQIATAQLITRAELLKKIDGNNKTAIENATKNLIDMELLATISPVGSTCYVITQKGTRLLRD